MRPSSTTTRIKTVQAVQSSYWLEWVRDHCPLQQGLRLSHDVTLYNLVYCKYETIFHYNKD